MLSRPLLGRHDESSLASPFFNLIPFFHFLFFSLCGSVQLLFFEDSYLATNDKWLFLLILSSSIGLGLFSHCTFLLGHGYALVLVLFLLEGWTDKSLLATFLPGPPCGSVRIIHPGERGEGKRAKCLWICAFGSKMHRN